jgi:hypothetical protein
MFDWHNLSTSCHWEPSGSNLVFKGYLRLPRSPLAHSQ